MYKVPVLPLERAPPPKSLLKALPARKQAPTVLRTVEYVKEVKEVN